MTPPPHSQLYNMDKQGIFSFFKHFSHFLCVQTNFLERPHVNNRLYPRTPIIIVSPLSVMTGSSPCLQVWLFATAINNFVLWSGRTTQSMSFRVHPAFSLSVWVSYDSSLPSCAACGDWMSDFEEALKSNFLRWFSSKTWLMDCWRDSSSEHQEYL